MQLDHAALTGWMIREVSGLAEALWALRTNPQGKEWQPNAWCSILVQLVELGRMDVNRIAESIVLWGGRDRHDALFAIATTLLRAGRREESNSFAARWLRSEYGVAHRLAQEQDAEERRRLFEALTEPGPNEERSLYELSRDYANALAPRFWTSSLICPFVLHPMSVRPSPDAARSLFLFEGDYGSELVWSLVVAESETMAVEMAAWRGVEGRLRACELATVSAPRNGPVGTYNGRGYSLVPRSVRGLGVRTVHDRSGLSTLHSFYGAIGEENLNLLSLREPPARADWPGVGPSKWRPFPLDLVETTGWLVSSPPRQA
ncbi:MAG: hypothetical protein AAF411_17850 [Myxococcota bacterium]